MDRPDHSALVFALDKLCWNDAKQMAIHLDNVDFALLQDIEHGYPIEQRVMLTMKAWLERDGEASWDKVVSALKVINNNALAMKIEADHPPVSAPPPQPTLLPPGRPTVSQDVGSDSNRARSREIIEAATQIQDTFVTVVMHTQMCLLKKEAESKMFLMEFRIMLKNLPLSNKHKHLHFLEREKMRITRAKNVEEILDILEPYWKNHVDYAFLERIINEFGTKELREEMEAYIANLEHFEKNTSVQEFNSTVRDKGIIPDYFIPVSVEQNKDPEKCSLYEVRQFKNELVKQASLKSYAVYLRSISCSSVVIVLATPPKAQAELLEVINDEEFMIKHKIASKVLTCQGPYSPVLLLEHIEFERLRLMEEVKYRRMLEASRAIVASAAAAVIVVAAAAAVIVAAAAAEPIAAIATATAAAIIATVGKPPAATTIILSIAVLTEFLIATKWIAVKAVASVREEDAEAPPITAVQVVILMTGAVVVTVEERTASTAAAVAVVTTIVLTAGAGAVMAAVAAAAGILEVRAVAAEARAAASAEMRAQATEAKAVVVAELRAAAELRAYTAAIANVIAANEARLATIAANRTKVAAVILAIKVATAVAGASAGGGAAIAMAVVAALVVAVQAAGPVLGPATTAAAVVVAVAVVAAMAAAIVGPTAAAVVVAAAGTAAILLLYKVHILYGSLTNQKQKTTALMV